jgi:hypothetical protein
MKIFESPQKIEYEAGKTIFLAGTIDGGASNDWQAQVAEALQATDYVVCNPRRKAWNESWQETIDDPQFVEQVNWELDALEQADLVLVNFLPNSKSPISLLELGLFAKAGKLKVCCPAGFWKRGNVQIVCKRFGIPIYESLAEMLMTIVNA